MCSIIGFCDKRAQYEVVKAALLKTTSRGPDDTRIVDTGNGYLGFNRLAIMGLTDAGMQPFELDGSYVVCNGEIYGFRPLREKLAMEGYTFQSDSDCEILLPLWRELGPARVRLVAIRMASSSAITICPWCTNTTRTTISRRSPTTSTIFSSRV